MLSVKTYPFSLLFIVFFARRAVIFIGSMPDWQVGELNHFRRSQLFNSKSVSDEPLCVHGIQQEPIGGYVATKWNYFQPTAPLTFPTCGQISVKFVHIEEKCHWTAYRNPLGWLWSDAMDNQSVSFLQFPNAVTRDLTQYVGSLSSLERPCWCFTVIS